jgi:His/Glu/Gln/Arg/opine family amino acid ABC transporter permease subunit
MMMEFATFKTYIPLLLTGAVNTLWLTLGTLLLGFVIAFPVALCRNSPSLWAQRFATGFVFVFRGTPLLALLFMVYYGGPEIKLIRETFLWVVFRDAVPCAILALSLNSAGFLVGVIAGALASVPKGQIEAGRSLGFSPWQVFSFVRMPNAIRTGIRSYGNEVIFVLKGTAVASMVTIADIMSAANQIYFNTFDPITPMLAAAALYLAIVLVLTLLMRRLERKFAVPGL